MGNLSQSDMMIAIILIAVILILIGVICILDILAKKKKKEEILENELDVENDSSTNSLPDVEELPRELVQPQIVTPVIVETTQPMIKTTKIEEIKYVEEDEELEKTKAKLELEELKAELRRQEEEKRLEEVKVIEQKEEPIVIENVTTEEVKPVEEKIEEIEVKEDVVPVEQQAEKVVVEATSEKETVVVEEIVETKEEVSDIANAINEQLIKEEIETKEANLQKANEVQEDLNELLEIGIEQKIAEYEDEQERKAIISVEEFNKISDEMYDNNEVLQMAYEDEGNEPISLEELESLYNTREMKTIKLEDFETVQAVDEKEAILKDADIKKLEDLPPIAMEKKFKSSPFISPVFGISETKESLELEQTANLDKLNEEIKKTNEFLKTLKELQKNLD